LTPLGKTLSGFFESPALADELEQMTVMHETIEKWRDDDCITEHGREPPNSNE